MAKRRLKKGKAYNYATFGAARVRGFTLKQWQNSKIAKKRWDNLPQLKKEIILENLAKGRFKQKFKKKFEKQKILDEEIVEVYEVVSQSHYDARGRTPKGKKYNTLFEYTTKGYFQQEPSLEKLEKMTKNSLIGAFNSGKTGKGGYLKNSAFNTLVDNNLRGIKINKVLVPLKDINKINYMEAEISINNNGYKWKGKN